MKLIRPTAITDATLVSSTVAEDPHAAWATGTSYAVDAVVSRATTHRVYRSLIAANAGNAPETNPTKWQDIGPTNRWAMFDEAVGTRATRTGSIEVVISPGAIDSLAIVDADAALAEVVMTDAGEEVYRREASFNIGGSAITDWALYFFEPIGRREVLPLLDLPNYDNGVITVTLTADNPDTEVACGTLIVGRQLDCGETGADAQPAFSSFSKKTTNDFGVTTVVKRAWARLMQLSTQMPSTSVDAVMRAVVATRDTPVLWLADEGFDCLTVYGFIKDFRPVINKRDGTTLTSWSIEGII